MRKSIFAILCLLILNVGFPATSLALEQFNTEQAAQNSCPGDKVVWLNLPTGVYHYRHQRWYGATKNGAYVCEKDAIKSGKRASKRG